MPPTAPVGEDLLRHINVTNGRTTGTVGVLRDGKVRWPLELKESVYDKERKRGRAL